MFLLRFDMRLAPDGVPAPAMYEAALAMAEWADSRPCLAVTISEHHASPDGYLPSPLLLAAAVAARTRRVPIQVAALLATLRHPVQTAEELAVLDILSGGRLSVVLGMGYRPEEFALYGIPLDERAPRMEAAVATFRRAWAGEPLALADGAEPVPVTPPPSTPGGPMLLLGGGTRAAARRAGRLGLGMVTERAAGELRDVYVEACRAEGREPGPLFGAGDAAVAAVFVDRDPDAAWDRIGPHLLRDARAYADWNVGAAKPMPGTVADVRSVDDVRRSGRYLVLTPEEAVERIRSEGPLVVHPLCGGTPPDLGWPTLHLLADEVLPALA